MSHKEIIEECFKNMHKNMQTTLIEQIKFGQWYRRTFKSILYEKGVVTQDDMEEAYKRRAESDI